MCRSAKSLSAETAISATVKTRWIAAVYLALAASTIAVYWPVRNFEFVNFDDTKYVRDNPYVNSGFTRQGLAWAFTDSISYWHPLTWLSHMLDCQLFGVNPGPHHLVNLFFHIANTVLLFTILWKMTSACWRSAFVAAAFALHPLRAESVAWIVERKDVLSALFWMLTILVYLRYLKRQGAASYLLALALFALALMAKPTVVTLPFVLLLLDYWPLERFSTLSSAPSRKIFYRLIIEKIPFFVLSAISFYVSSTSTQRLANAITTVSVPMTLRIANAIVSYVKYIVMHIWPGALSPFYPYPDSIPLWQVIGALLLLSLLLVCIFRTIKTRPYFLVGSLWFFGTLLPSIGLVQAGLWPAVADRFTYLSSIGVFLVVAWAFYDLLKNYRYKNLVGALSATAVLGAFAVTSHLQVGYWQNSNTLFEHALKVNKDNYVAHSSLAYVLCEQGKRDEAIAHYYQSLSIKPSYATSHVNLGAALAAKGQIDEAEKHFTEAIRMDPRLAAAHSSLAKLYAQQDKLDLAVAYYGRALELEPLNYAVYNSLGQALARQGKLADAIANFNKALQLNPSSAQIHANLGQALVEEHSFDKAVEHLDKAIQLDPNSAKSYFYLARALSEKKQYSAAVVHLRRAIELKSDWPAAINSLAWFLAAYKNSDFYNPGEAVNLAERACEMTNYDDPGFLDTLAVAYAAADNFTEAVATAEKALQLAQTRGQNEPVGQIRDRLELYKNSKTYSEN